jgi:hypothetical protein
VIRDSSRVDLSPPFLFLSNLENGSNNSLSTQAQTSLNIVQITPVGLMPPSYAGIIELGVYGQGFDSTSKVFLDNIDFSPYISLITPNKISLMLDANIIRQITYIQVKNDLSVSNYFNAKETTLRYPEIVDLSSRIVGSNDQQIVIKGYNFFGSNSNLYLDGVVVDSNFYSLSHGEDGGFTISLNLQNLPQAKISGPHNLMIDNPPRYPSLSLSRINSDLVYFYADSQVVDDFIFENDKIKLTFEGNTGILKSLQNKETGHINYFNGLYPWRMELRKLSDLQQKTSSKNPLLLDFFNPFKGKCSFSNSVSNSGSVSTLTLSWDNCQIDSTNSFSFYQTYVLNQSSTDFSFSYKVRPISVNDYALHAVRLYMAPVDNSSLDSYGISSTYSVDTFLNPGTSIKTKGTADFCSALDESWRSCDKVVGVADFNEYYYLFTDGDGFQIFNFLDLWTAYWDSESNYLMVVPTDNRSYDKYYDYQGYFGTYKSTAVTFIPDDYSTSGFNYDLPYSFKVFTGNSQNYVGKETWVYLADLFRSFQQSFGRLGVSFEQKNSPEFLKNLDLLWVSDHASEFFTLDSNGNAIGYVQNPAISQIADGYRRAKSFYGANNAFLVFWRGDQDITGQSKIGIKPIPGVTFSLFDLLNQYGIRPCFYSLYLKMPSEDAISMNLQGDIQQLDPNGTLAINQDSFYGPLAIMHPASTSLTGSYLSWLVERFRIMNNNQTGARCFYLDGVASQPPFPEGVWSSKFGSKSADKELVESYTSLRSDLISAVRNVDPEAFFLHESFLQDSADMEYLSAQGTPIAFDTLGREGKFAQRDVLFLQRIYGGYDDFLIAHPNPITGGPPFFYVENVMVNALKQMGAIPQNYVYSLTDSYNLLAEVGFVYGGGVPVALDGVSINRGAGYIPLNEIKNATQGFRYKSGEWSDALESYSAVVKEQVAARNLARDYFHGLWYPELQTDSPKETYYYINDFNKLLEGDPIGLMNRTYPRVLSIVRRAWHENSASDRYGILLYNTYTKESEQTISFNFDFNRYGLDVGQNYNLFLKNSTGRYYILSSSNNFDYSVTLPSGKFMLLELEKGSISGTCGDNICSGPETCSSCATDCGPCSVGGPGGSSGGGGGGGSSGGFSQNYKPQCDDGVDNDGDGFIDFPNDPGCTSKSGNSELDSGTLGGDVDGSFGTSDSGSNNLDSKSGFEINKVFVFVASVIVLGIVILVFLLIRHSIIHRRMNKFKEMSYLSNVG